MVCNHGRHRSVAFATMLEQLLQLRGFRASLVNHDLGRAFTCELCKRQPISLLVSSACLSFYVSCTPVCPCIRPPPVGLSVPGCPYVCLLCFCFVYPCVRPRLSVHGSVRPFVRPSSVCLFVCSCLLACLPGCLVVCRISVCSYVLCLSSCPVVCVSVGMSACLCVCLSSLSVSDTVSSCPC